MKPSEEPDNDAELFLDAVKDVKRINSPNLADLNFGRSEHVNPQEVIANRGEYTGDEGSGFVRPGIQKMVLRRLRNGKIPVEEELDLHGHTVSEAEHELKAFLRSAQAPRRQRAVRVIHGKGFGSPEGKPVLKHKVVDCLHQSVAVLAFCTAGFADGGDGAVRILLRPEMTPTQISSQVD